MLARKLSSFPSSFLITGENAVLLYIKFWISEGSRGQLYHFQDIVAAGKYKNGYRTGKTGVEMQCNEVMRDDFRAST